MRLLAILILLSTLCESVCHDHDDASQTAMWTDDNDSTEDDYKTEMIEDGRKNETSEADNSHTLDYRMSVMGTSINVGLLPEEANRTDDQHTEDVSLLIAAYSTNVLLYEGNQSDDPPTCDATMDNMTSITHNSADEVEAKRFDGYSFFKDIVTKMIRDDKKILPVGNDGNKTKAVYRRIRHNLAEQILLDLEYNRFSKWGDIKNKTVMNIYKEPSSATQSSVTAYSAKTLPNEADQTENPLLLDANMDNIPTGFTQNLPKGFDGYVFFIEIMSTMIEDNRKNAAVGSDGKKTKAVYRCIRHNLAEQILLDPEYNRFSESGNVKNETIVNNMYKEPSSVTTSSFTEYSTNVLPKEANLAEDPCTVNTNMSVADSSISHLPNEANQFYKSHTVEVNMNDTLTEITQDAAHKDTSNELGNYGFFALLGDMQLKLIHITNAFFDKFPHVSEEADATRELTETERRRVSLLTNRTTAPNNTAVHRRLNETICEKLKAKWKDPEYQHQCHMRLTAFELIMAAIFRGNARFTNRMYYYGGEIIQGSLVVMESAVGFIWVSAEHCYEITEEFAAPSYQFTMDKVVPATTYIASTTHWIFYEPCNTFWYMSVAEWFGYKPCYKLRIVKYWKAATKDLDMFNWFAEFCGDVIYFMFWNAL